MLIARPHHMGMCDRSGMSCSGKEEYLTFLAAFCNGFLIHLCPDRRPLVMDDRRILSTVKHSVDRQILTKICHPATHAKSDHIFLDQSLVPLVCLWVGKINHSCRESRNGHQIIFALAILDTITVLRCICI